MRTDWLLCNVIIRMLVASCVWATIDIWWTRILNHNTQIGTSTQTWVKTSISNIMNPIPLVVWVGKHLFWYDLVVPSQSHKAIQHPKIIHTIQFYIHKRSRPPTWVKTSPYDALSSFITFVLTCEKNSKLGLLGYWTKPSQKSRETRNTNWHQTNFIW